MKRIFFTIVGLWCIMCLSLRCYMNLTGFQTGRTVGKGKAEAVASYSWVFNSPIFYSLSDNQPEDDLVEDIRILEHQVSWGAGEKFDLGYRGGFNRVGVFAKYGFLDREKPVGFALGFGAGYVAGGEKPYFELPLCLSFHPCEYFDFYFSPAFATVLSNGRFYLYKAKRLDFYGANTGFFLGKRLKFGVDYGLFNMSAGKRSF